eukprot:c10329_g1_i2.p1 GENE.c10329_g1_i2~~c10329_g1_i2.p1  ORF type:complete len:248 (+),score=23.71 c10329_g1_i2:624-1367(+)
MRSLAVWPRCPLHVIVTLMQNHALSSLPPLAVSRVATLTLSLAPSRTRASCVPLRSYGEQDEVIDEACADDPPPLVAWRAAHEESVLRNEAIKAAVVMRSGLAYGRSGSLFGRLMAEALSRRKLSFPGDGGNYLAMVHVDDLASSFVKAAEANLSGAYVFVIAGSNELVSEILRAIAKAAALKGGAIEYTGKPADEFARCLVMSQKADSSRARQTLGWMPRHRPFCDDVARYFDAFLAFREAGIGAR